MLHKKIIKVIRFYHRFQNMYVVLMYDSSFSMLQSSFLLLTHSNIS